jgi:hypothetical protein
MASKRRVDAYHEAGHAMAALVLGKCVYGLIFTDEGARALIGKERLALVQEVAVLAAGVLAEGASGEPADEDWNSSSDDQEIERLLRLEFPDHSAQRDLAWSAGRQLADKIVNEQKSLIRAVAGTFERAQSMSAEGLATIITASDPCFALEFVDGVPRGIRRITS